ncbi:MAG: hypothetical protein PVJ57_14840 [Phycisphaerae bacterium]
MKRGSVREASDYNTRIAAVGQELAAAFEALLQAMPEQPRRPQTLARILDIDKSVSHRLVTAIRKADPLATAHVIPGPGPLRRIAQAARKRRVPVSVAQRVDDAIGAFEALIHHEGGDRSSLDAIISASLPSAREEYQKLAKRTLHRGARQLKGTYAHVHFTADLLHPSGRAGWCDLAVLQGFLGLRRVHPEATLRLGILAGSANCAARQCTMEREPIADAQQVLWHPYCSQPEVELTIHRFSGSDVQVYELAWGNAVGADSVRDVVMRSLTTEATRRRRSTDDPRQQAAVTEFVIVPARTLVFDVLLHEDVYRETPPQLLIREMGALGWSDPNDRTRDLDVLPLRETVESLGTGVKRFRVDEIPHYIDMLEEVCQTLGWDSRKFRGYRSRIDFPILGTEVQYVLDVPIEPSSSPTGPG